MIDWTIDLFTGDSQALAMTVAIAVLLIAGALPGYIAHRRQLGTTSTIAYTLVGIMFLPTGIGWIIAMVCALSDKPTSMPGSN